MRTIQDLYQKQALPLNIKVRLTQARIREWETMYGLKRTDISIETHILDGRKKPCIMVGIGNKYYKVGQFNDKQTAENFFTILDYVCFENNEDKAREIIAGCVE